MTRHQLFPPSGPHRCPNEAAHHISSYHQNGLMMIDTHAHKILVELLDGESHDPNLPHLNVAEATIRAKWRVVQIDGYGKGDLWYEIHISDRTHLDSFGREPNILCPKNTPKTFSAPYMVRRHLIKCPGIAIDDLAGGCLSIAKAQRLLSLLKAPKNTVYRHLPSTLNTYHIYVYNIYILYAQLDLWQIIGKVG